MKVPEQTFLVVSDSIDRRVDMRDVIFSRESAEEMCADRIRDKTEGVFDWRIVPYHQQNLQGGHDFLLALNKVFPAPAPRQHGLVLREDGLPGLMLLFQAKDKPMAFLIDEEDLSKPLETLIAEIVKLVEYVEASGKPLADLLNEEKLSKT